MMCMMLIGAVNVYLFKDYFGNAAALSIVGFIQTAAAFVAIPLVKPLVAKFGKKETAAIGMLIASLAYGTFILLTELGLISILSCVAAVGMFGFGFFNLVVWAFVTDVIDYHEYINRLT